MKRENWIVTKQSESLAGKEGECFYCQAKIGEQHNSECVIRQKTVVVDFTIRTVIDVPEHWDNEFIEERYNWGSWCADNLIDDLHNRNMKVNNGNEMGGDCLCNCTSAKYIRDATAEDEEKWGACKVDELES